MKPDKEIEEILGDVWMAGHDYATQAEGLEALRNANDKDTKVMGKATHQIKQLLAEAELRGAVRELEELQKIGKVAFLQSFVEDRLATLQKQLDKGGGRE